GGWAGSGRLPVVPTRARGSHGFVVAASHGRDGVVVAPTARGEDVPDGQEQRGDHRPEQQAVDPEQGEAAERRDQHDVVRDARVLADEDRPQHVVDQTDHERAVGEKDEALPQLAGGEQVDRNRPPDDRRAYGRQQRQDAHHDGPQRGRGAAEHAEDQPPQRALNDGDGERALDHRPDYQRELLG